MPYWSPARVVIPAVAKVHEQAGPATFKATCPRCGEVHAFAIAPGEDVSEPLACGGGNVVAVVPRDFRGRE